MILITFDVKFQEKNNEIPPRARRPSKSKDKRQFAGYGPKKVRNKSNVGKVGSPPARPFALAGGPGGAASQEEKKGGIY